MLFRHLRAAERHSAAAGGVDQRPGLVARRVLEGRAAGAAAQRLRFLARGGDAVHLGADRRRDRRACRGTSRRRPPRRRAVRYGDRCSRAARAAIPRPRPSAARASPRPACPAPRGHRRRRSSARSRRPCRGFRAGIRARRCRRRAPSRTPGCRSPRRRSAASTSSSCSILANALPSRTTTPGTPPSRTIMFEPRPSAITGTSGSSSREEVGQIVGVGRLEQPFAPRRRS